MSANIKTRNPAMKKSLFNAIGRSSVYVIISLLVGMATMKPLPVNAMSCFGEDEPVFVFGAYDPQLHEHHDVQTIFHIYCMPAYRGEQLNLNIRLNGITTDALRMRNLETGEWLRFAVYKDPAHSQPIDSLNSISLSMPLLVPTTLAVPVYGRIPARQDVSVGSYLLPLSVSMTY